MHWLSLFSEPLALFIKTSRTISLMDVNKLIMNKLPCNANESVVYRLIIEIS